MTKTIILQGNIEFQLICEMRCELFGSSIDYIFKLYQREKGKRKWNEIREATNKYSVSTKMEYILKYLSKDQVIKLAKLEHERFAPTESLFEQCERITKKFST